MDVTVKGRHCELPERFRQHVVDKLAKLEKLDHKVARIDVEVCKERNPRLADRSDRVELTCYSRGPVIRAEACAQDPYAALDLAVSKLEMRLRRSADRRRVHYGNRTPVSVAAATAPAAADTPAAGAVPAGANGKAPAADPVSAGGVVTSSGVTDTAEMESAAGGVLAADGPFVVREKTHEASPMTLDQALFEMELVGHDFYLFVDSDVGLPSVVYRRVGYDYGVIRLKPL